MKDSELRRKLAGLAAIAGPLVLSTADILARGDILSNYTLLTYPALLIYLLADTLVISSILGLTRLLRNAPGGYAVFVSVAAFIGYMGGTNIWSEKITHWAMMQTDSTAYEGLIQGMPSDVWLASFLPIHSPGLFFSVSLLLLGVGFWRWTELPRWTGAFLVAGALLFPLGRVSATLSIILPSELALAAILASDLCLAISLVPLGWKLLSGKIAWSADSGPVQK